MIDLPTFRRLRRIPAPALAALLVLRGDVQRAAEIAGLHAVLRMMNAVKGAA